MIIFTAPRRFAPISLAIPSSVPLAEQNHPKIGCFFELPDAIIAAAAWAPKRRPQRCPKGVSTEDHSMERAGEKLKRVRERLGLTYREVEQASQKIAQRRGSDEFAIALSRLADIENKGTVPTIYRVYTLCAIYGLDFSEVLRWYGVPLEQLPSEAAQTPLRQTRAVEFAPNAVATVP